jgi:predicted dinucleotide-binding enzyme
VVKAFNTVPSELHRAGAGVLPERPAVCYCRDDRAAKRSVAALIRTIGFERRDCGGLGVALLVAELAYKRHRSPLLSVRFSRPGSP